jgi:hypothetical protein
VTLDDTKKHDFEEGDFVRFVEVEGMTEINNREPVKVTKTVGRHTI